MLVTVVSTARPGQIIVDGGSKTFSSDRLATSSEVTFGHVVEAPECQLSQDERRARLRGCHEARGREFAIGDRVHIIPNHICVAVNLHETVYGIRGDKVEESWKVEGRGKLQ